MGWMVLSGLRHMSRRLVLKVLICCLTYFTHVLAQQVVQTSLGGHQSVDGYSFWWTDLLDEYKETSFQCIQDIPGLSASSRRRDFISSLKLTQCIASMMMNSLSSISRSKRRFYWFMVAVLTGKPDHFRIVNSSWMN